MNARIQSLAEVLWAYHRLGHTLEPADAILALCSHDLLVAEYAAKVYLDGWAPLLIFSGGLGTITRALWTRPEADQFAEIAIARGVPADNILIENKSANTGENVRFTRQLLADKQLDPGKFILVQKPYMERRSYATFRKVWPEKQVIVTSPKLSLAEYLDHYRNIEMSEDDVINIMVGDTQRVKVYGDLGFQIHQDIPSDVWTAYEELVSAGYDTRLVAPAGKS